MWDSLIMWHQLRYSDWHARNQQGAWVDLQKARVAGQGRQWLALGIIITLNIILSKK